MFKNRKKRLTLLLGILVLVIIGFLVYMKMTIWADSDNSTQKKTMNPEYIADQIIVKFNKPLTDQEITDKIIQKTTKPPKKIIRPLKENNKFSNLYVLKIDTSAMLGPNEDSELKNAIKVNGKKEKIDKVLHGLKIDGDVEYVEQDLKLSLQNIPNDPYYSSSGAWGQQFNDMWGLHKIQSATAWDTTKGNNNITIAVIDSGVDYNIPDLSPNILRDINNQVVGYDFVNSDSDPQDDYGHGTHIAGVIGAVGNNSLGGVGVDWNIKIMPVKIADSAGMGSVSDAISGTIWATDHGAKIINDSWSGAGQSQGLADAILYSHSMGVVTIASAGNYNSDVAGFTPAGLSEVITVSAYDNYDNRASFSNFGKIDVAAPGVSILSNIPTGLSSCAAEGTPVGSNYCVFSGTSLSAAFVSGLAALIYDKNPEYSNEQIRQALQLGSDDVDTSGWDSRSGYGRINAAKSLLVANFLEGNISSMVRDQPDTHEVSIYGNAKGAGFFRYTLSYSATIDGNSWTEFASGSVAVTDGLLGTLNMATVPLLDRYYVKLSVKNVTGASYEDVDGPLYNNGVKGKVTNIVTGQPVSGITVSVLRENTTVVATTTTAQDGSYELKDVLQEINIYYWIKTSNPNYVTRSTTLYRTGPNPSVTTIDFPITALSDAGTVSGKVIDVTTGQGVQATFMIYDNCYGPGYQFTTAADGTFSRPNQCVKTPQSMGITGSSQYKNESRSVILSPKQTMTFDFYLVPKTSSSGSIRAQIWTSSAKTQYVDSGNITAFQGSTIKKTNNFYSGGNGILTPIIVGTYSVTVDAPGYESQTKTGVVVNANQDTYLEFIMVPGGGGQDTTAPTVNITSPINGSSYDVGRRLTFSANAADNVGVKKVDFYVNGVLVGSDTKEAYSVTWNTSEANLSQGITFLKNNLMWMIGDCSAGGATVFSQPNGAKTGPKTGIGGNLICPVQEPSFFYPNLPTGWIYTDDRKNLDGDVDVLYKGSSINYSGYCAPTSLNCKVIVTLTAKATDEAGNIGQSNPITIIPY